MDNTADANNFIVVYPDGIANEWNVGWTGTYGTGVNDVGFVSAIIDTLYQLYSIDFNRVYACGLSNGGYLSHRLACELENRIAAVAPVSGTLTDSTLFYCHPTRKMPIMHMHGTADPIVPYGGLTGSLSTEQTISFWLNKSTCNTPGDTTDVPNTNTTDGSTVQKIDYPVCANGVRILLCKITGGGHTWPGGSVDVPAFGNTNRDIDANTEMWNFFKQYTLNSTTDVDLTPVPETYIRVFPNPVKDEIKIEAGGKIEHLEVYNVLGERVITQTPVAVNALLHLATLESGIYFLKISSNDFTHTERICKN